jgi:hypothetical protein
MHMPALTSSMSLATYLTHAPSTTPRVSRDIPADRVTLTPAAQRCLAHPDDPKAAHDQKTASAFASPGTASGLSVSDQQAIAALRQRDREVRAHEMAHLLAAGPHAHGGPQFSYEIGPDGKRYAVAGAVPIDVSPVPGDPSATMEKAATIRRAALAPAHPSSADMAIAAKASTMMSHARQELLSLQREVHAAEQDPNLSPPTTDRQDGSEAVTNPTAAHICDAHCKNHATQPDVTTPTSTKTASTGPTVFALQNYHAAPQRQAAFSVTV